MENVAFLVSFLNITCQIIDTFCRPVDLRWREIRYFIYTKISDVSSSPFCSVLFRFPVMRSDVNVNYKNRTFFFWGGGGGLVLKVKTPTLCEGFPFYVHKCYV